MHLRTGLIAIGLVAALLPCASAAGQEQGPSAGGENLFRRALRVSGQLTKKTGEAMSDMAKGREESLLGKGLDLGGRVNQSVGQAVEDAADGRGGGAPARDVAKAGANAAGTGGAGEAAPARRRRGAAPAQEAAGAARAEPEKPARGAAPGAKKGESLFTQSLRLSGQMTAMTGDAMSDMSKGREDSLLGKGLALGGRVNTATGKAVEDSANNRSGVGESMKSVTKAGFSATTGK